MFGFRNWFERGQSSLSWQLQPYWVTFGFNKFLLCPDIIDDMLLIQLYLIFTMFLLKILWSLFVSGKSFFYEGKEGLTNICFDICRIWCIIPYYFTLSLFITNFIIFILCWCITQFLLKYTLISSIPVSWFSFFKNFFISWQIRYSFACRFRQLF